jgi:diguanylate cyclase (GGDEF)-like protein/PAS domain S-box-containing protein
MDLNSVPRQGEWYLEGQGIGDADPGAGVRGGLLGLLFENSADGILLIDDGRLIDCNQAAASMLGYKTIEQLLSCRPDQLSPESQPDGSLSAEKEKILMAEALKEGNKRFDWVYKRVDGEEFPVEVLLTAVPVPGRRMLYALWRDISERRRGENTLKKTLRTTRHILEKAPFGVMLIDQNGAIEYANVAMDRISGSPRAMYKRLNIFKIPINKELGIAKKVRSALRGKSFTLGPVEYTASYSGKKTIRNVTGMPLEEEGKRKALLFVEDVTEQKRAEELLKTERETFLSILQKAPYGVILMNEDGKFLYVNQEFTKITGYTLEDVPTGRDWFREAYPDREQRHKAVGAWKKDPLAESVIRTFNVVCKDGTGRELEFRPTQLDDGRAITTIADVTERKRAEELFRILANNSPMGIYIARHGRFEFVNPYFRNVAGYEEEELLNKECDALVFNDDRQQVRENSIKILKGEGLSAHEYRVVNKAGEIRWVLDTVTSIQYRDGRAILGNFIDITEHKQAEGQMLYMSLHDNLTGLYNRTYFEEEMARLAGTRFNPVGIVMCDVDGLKLINDILGHNAGDALLVAAANVIRKCFRENDVVARVGGDEFAVILPNTPKAVIENICLRIHDMVGAYNAEHPTMTLSISVGFAVKFDSSTRMSELFREADNNMYSQKLCQTQQARNAIVGMLMKALEMRGVITEQRVEHIQRLVAAMAGKLGLNQEGITSLRFLAKFRDIGEIGIPHSIYEKRDLLTPEELSEVRRHCEIGYRIAMSTPDLTPIADQILKHHEWWDGNGYPLGLKGEEIPLECRILSISGAYDAMVSDRPYRKAMPHDKAIAELKRRAGTQFDPRLVELFLSLPETN